MNGQVIFTLTQAGQGLLHRGFHRFLGNVAPQVEAAGIGVPGQEPPGEALRQNVNRGVFQAVVPANLGQGRPFQPGGQPMR